MSSGVALDLHGQILFYLSVIYQATTAEIEWALRVRHRQLNNHFTSLVAMGQIIRIRRGVYELAPHLKETA